MKPILQYKVNSIHNLTVYICQPYNMSLFLSYLFVIFSIKFLSIHLSVRIDIFTLNFLECHCKMKVKFLPLIYLFIFESPLLIQKCWSIKKVPLKSTKILQIYRLLEGVPVIFTRGMNLMSVCFWHAMLFNNIIYELFSKE